MPTNSLGVVELGSKTREFGFEVCYLRMTGARLRKVTKVKVTSRRYDVFLPPTVNV